MKGIKEAAMLEWRQGLGLFVAGFLLGMSWVESRGRPLWKRLTGTK